MNLPSLALREVLRWMARIVRVPQLQSDPHCNFIPRKINPSLPVKVFLRAFIVALRAIAGVSRRIDAISGAANGEKREGRNGVSSPPRSGGKTSSPLTLLAFSPRTNVEPSRQYQSDAICSCVGSLVGSLRTPRAWDIMDGL